MAYSEDFPQLLSFVKPVGVATSSGRAAELRESRDATRDKRSSFICSLAQHISV